MSAQFTAMETARFRLCSGQGRYPKSWAVMSSDPRIPWWRWCDARGRVHLFSSAATASRAMALLEAVTPAHAEFVTEPLAETVRSRVSGFRYPTYGWTIRVQETTP